MLFFAIFQTFLKLTLFKFAVNLLIFVNNKKRFLQFSDLSVFFSNLPGTLNVKVSNLL